MQPGKMKRMGTALALAAMIAGSWTPGLFSAYAASAADAENGLSSVGETSAVSAKSDPYVSSGLDTTSAEDVDVIVQLETEPVVVAKHNAVKSLAPFSEENAHSSLTQEQKSFVENAQAEGIPVTLKRQYQYILNGMELRLPANRIPELSKLPGVVSIHENKWYYTIPNVEKVSVDDTTYKYDINPLRQIGVPELWAKGLTGKGLKVGVIDTGVDYLHPDLKDAYKGGYDSYDQDPDPYEQAPIPQDLDPEKTGYEGSEHGTHVSGTIVGRAVNESADVNVKGIAYEADLYVYRVLGRHGGSSAQVIDGIERSVKDGMDVINLSLGSDLEKNANSPDAIALNNAVLAGVVVVVANGNAADSGPYYYSMGSPAGAQLPITVGAVDSPSNHYTATASVYGDVYSPYEFNAMAWKTNHENFADVIGTDPLELVYVNLGGESDYYGKDLTGKVALISRGTLSFTTKIANAQQAGAKAAIIFNGNDLDGDGVADLDLPSSFKRDGYINAFIGDGVDYLPTFDMKGLEGRRLAKALLADPTQSVTIKFDGDYPKTTESGDYVASFSSRGPNSDGTLGIKPDVTAPGVAVMSSIPAWSKLLPDQTYDKAYARFSGTSMATPHVAGVSLLLKQAHPSWTPFDIKAALANTAESTSDESGTPYDVYSQGAGRVNAAKAAVTPAVLQTVEKLSILDGNLQVQQVTNYGSNYSFGVIAPESGAKSVQLQLKNVSDGQASYKASVKLHPKVTGDPSNPTETPDVAKIDAQLTGLAADQVVTANKGAAVAFGLQVKAAEDADEGVYEGEVLLDSVNSDDPDLHLPFVLHVGNENPDTQFGLQDISLSANVISPNGDGMNDTLTASVQLRSGGAEAIAVEAWGYDDLFIGTLDYTAAGSGQYLQPGTYSFTVDGTYLVFDSQGAVIRKKLPDGNYKLRFTAGPFDPSKLRISLDDQNNVLYEAWKAFGVEADKPFAIGEAKLEKTGGMKASVVVEPVGREHDGDEFVVFQLMKGKTPISLVVLEKDIVEAESVGAFFNVAGDDYAVDVYVTDKFAASKDQAGTILANTVELK